MVKTSILIIKEMPEKIKPFLFFMSPPTNGTAALPPSAICVPCAFSALSNMQSMPTKYFDSKVLSLCNILAISSLYLAHSPLMVWEYSLCCSDSWKKLIQENAEGGAFIRTARAAAPVDPARTPVGVDERKVAGSYPRILKPLDGLHITAGMPRCHLTPAGISQAAYLPLPEPEKMVWRPIAHSISTIFREASLFAAPGCVASMLTTTAMIVHEWTPNMRIIYGSEKKVR